MQAVAVVTLAAIAGSVGVGVWPGHVVASLVVAVPVSILLWMAWAMLAFQIGTRLLPEPDTRASWPQLLRTTGFAAAPGVIQVAGVFTPWSDPVFIAAQLWMFAAMVVALRQALDYRQLWRAFAVTAVSVVLILILVVVFTVVLVGAITQR